MKRFLQYALAVAAAVLVTAGIANAMPAGVAAMQTQMLEPTVQLDNGCSGQIIYSRRDEKSGEVSTYILTAKHCVSDVAAKDVFARVPTYDKRSQLVAERAYLVDVFAQSYSGDLALLVLKDKVTWFSQKAKLAPIDIILFEGEPTWTVGYPLAATRTITAGLFGAGMRLAVGGGSRSELTRATDDIAPGSSGGGLYHVADDGGYELIGVTSAGARGYPFIGLYNSIYDIQKFLKIQAPAVYKEIYGADAGK